MHKSTEKVTWFHSFVFYTPSLHHLVLGSLDCKLWFLIWPIIWGWSRHTTRTPKGSINHWMSKDTKAIVTTVCSQKYSLFVLWKVMLLKLPEKAKEHCISPIFEKISMLQQTNHSQAIHPTEIFISMNLLQMPCVIT